jgi:hypothetical protein
MKNIKDTAKQIHEMLKMCDWHLQIKQQMLNDQYHK